MYLAAPCAFMNNNVSLLWIGNNFDRFHRGATFAGAITGVYVNVKRPEAEWAVIARGISEWLYLLAAMGADEAVIVF